MTKIVARKRFERVLLMASPRAMPPVAKRTEVETPAKWRISPNPNRGLSLWQKGVKMTYNVILTYGQREARCFGKKLKKRMVMLGIP